MGALFSEPTVMWASLLLSRCSWFSQHERDLVDVAPAPLFPGFGGAGDRVPRAAGVGGGVPVRRAVAATDATAGLAHAQVHPGAPDREAFLAAGDHVGELGHLDAVEVRADRVHRANASIKEAAS